MIWQSNRLKTFISPVFSLTGTRRNTSITGVNEVEVVVKNYIVEISPGTITFIALTHHNTRIWKGTIDASHGGWTSDDIICKYERDEVKPSIEVAVKIADTLEVSLDYLVGKTFLELDKNTLKSIEEVSKLPAKARTQVFLVIDALVRDFKAKQAYS